MTEHVSDNEISLLNYSIIRCDSTSSRTGGVIFYIKKDIRYRLIDKIHIERKIWCLCVEIFVCDLSETVAIFYRSPDSSKVEFCNLFAEWLDRMLHTYFNIVILGDFNINLLSINNTYTKVINELLTNNHCKQLIQKPTRIEETSRSLLDFVISSVERKIWADTIPELKVSDHESIVVKIPVLKKETRKHGGFINIFKYNKSEFRVLISNKCSRLNHLHDLNSLSVALQDGLMYCVTKLTTRKKMVPSNNDQWFTQELNVLKQNKIRSFQRASLFNVPADWVNYRNIRNTYKNKLSAAKRNYVCNKIESCNNQKSMWRTLKKLVLKQKKDEIRDIKFSDNLESDSNIIADKFNTYFIESINNISNSIVTNSNILLLDELTEHTSIFKFRQITINELIIICKRINNKSAFNLNIKIFLDCFDIIGPIIVKIINLSFARGEFPSNLKESIVIPIPKETGTNVCEKFRPINMMPILEKIVEKSAYDQFYKYISENNILMENQSGFRHEHSCETSLNWLVTTLKQQRHEGNKIIAVFLDFQRAFETIDRNMLVKKLFMYGVKDAELDWFRSYLSNRTQRTSVNNKMSSAKSTYFGVPQGTILGPLLFLLYINDMCKVIRKSKISLFADDALLFVCGKDLNVLKSDIEHDLNRLCTWLQVNKLKLNASKTKCMVINSEFCVNLKINGDDIEQVEEIKYLGVKLDSKLNFNSHLAYIASKISMKIAFLKRIRKNITVICAVNIYNTTIKPHFEFCSTILFMGNHGDINRLQVLQNKAMRTILKCNFYTPISWMLSCLKWLNINQRIIFNVLTFVFKIKHRMVPEYLTSNLVYTQDAQPYGLRSNLDFRLQLFRDTRTQNMVLYRGLKLFNELPREIKYETIFIRFKKLLISHIRATVS